MSDHLHKTLNLDTNDVVVVNCDTQANVMLMRQDEYRNYLTGRSFRYHGGFQKYFPWRMRAPHAGEWKVVLDLGGRRGVIRHYLQVIKA